MANRTDKEAASIHGTNPQNLVENIVRQKIYQTLYWKESCFALTAETLIDKAVDLKAAGGTFGGARSPSNFMCLILKMLQIQPDKEIIIEYIKNEDFKYVRLLGAFYMRLVGRPLEVYQYLEPLYNDYRKIRVQLSDGNFSLSHVDELVDEILRKDYVFDIAMPRIPNRVTLERMGQLDPRLSVLDDEFDEAVLELEAGEAVKQAAEAAAAAEREQAAVAAARSSREEDERRDAEKRKEERQREKWREDPKERQREERSRAAAAAATDRAGAERGGRDRDQEESERQRSRRDRDRDGYDERDKDRGKPRYEERDDDKDRNRESRDWDRNRDRDRERERERRRGRSRSPSADPDRRRRERERSPDRERARREEPKAAPAAGKKAVNTLDPEIVAANELRAKLGLKPLK